MQASDLWDFVSSLFVAAGMLLKALLIAVAPAIVGWWLNRRDEKDPP